MQILTQYFENSVAPVIKFSPEFNKDFECPHSKMFICYKNLQVLTSQKRWRQILYFCMFSVSRLISIGVTWRFFVSFCQE